MKKLLSIISLLIILLSCTQQETITTQEARQIAKEAYTYANPMVDNYRGLYNYFIDTNNADYKGTWNKVINMARVYTHEDRTIQTANSDTPYSFVALDLRSEPIVLTVPKMEENRYFSIQLIDMYTHNFEFIGTRTVGNNGGSFLIAGPEWDGEKPDGIVKVIKAETELVLAAYRTQLFNPEDLEDVKQIQSEYKLQPLSSYLDHPAPQAAPDIQFIEPLTQEEIKASPKVFEQLNYLLQFCPTHPSEKELMNRFAKLGIGAGQDFNWDSFSPEVQDAIKQGISDSWADFEALKSQAEAGKLGSAEIFGTRQHLNNNYSYRMIAAVVGIWGASAEEAGSRD